MYILYLLTVNHYSILINCEAMLLSFMQMQQYADIY